MPHKYGEIVPVKDSTRKTGRLPIALTFLAGVTFIMAACSDEIPNVSIEESSQSKVVVADNNQSEPSKTSRSVMDRCLLPLNTQTSFNWEEGKNKANVAVDQGVITKAGSVGGIEYYLDLNGFTPNTFPAIKSGQLYSPVFANYSLFNIAYAGQYTAGMHTESAFVLAIQGEGNEYAIFKKITSCKALFDSFDIRTLMGKTTIPDSPADYIWNNMVEGKYTLS